MTDLRPEWDDERLRAAFRVRAELAPIPPIDLGDAVLERLDRRRVPTSRVGWLAAAAGVAVLVGIGSVMGVRPSPRAPAPAPTSLVESALGQPLTVSEALALPGDTDREVAVTGFLWSSTMTAVPCPVSPEPPNPTFLRCPETLTWIVERAPGGGARGVEPAGPAFHPSFALVDAPSLASAPDGSAVPLPVVLVGHFDDRRAEFCSDANRAICRQTFVVDRVAVVNGGQRMVATVRRVQRFDDRTQTMVTETPRDLEADVDRLVLRYASGGTIESRLLVTLDQVTRVEPVLADDQVIAHLGNPAGLMWLVTVVEVRGAVAVPRTFALLDGTNWLAEITADGTVMHEREVAAPVPSDGAQPISPSADPHAFDGAPTSVLGIPVRDIATLERDRRADVGDLGRDEIAIRAWYVAPRPGVDCPPTSAVGVAPPCDEARHWLLDRPDQLGLEPGQGRADPDHWPPVLNPLVPIDVPFDVGETWSRGKATPQPVIVLGHFEDHRVRTYAGNLWFVVDALAWTKAQGSLAVDSLVRLTPSTTEDAAAVLARIETVTDTPAAATWTTVVDAATFATLDPRVAEDAPEFTTGGPVWIVRRLVNDVMDGRTRLAIQWAYTADGGSRVWLTSQPDAPADLATTIDLKAPDAVTDVIRVFDYGIGVTAVRRASDSALDWQRIEDRDAQIDVARGRSEREVAVRWGSGTCDRAWDVRLQPRSGDPATIDVDVRTFDDYCPERPVTRSVLLVFDHAVDLDAFHVEYNPSGG